MLPIGVVGDSNHTTGVNSQNPTSSFHLHHDNDDPAGITTDGQTINPGDVNHIWVVDKSADKVFEYQGGAFFTSGDHRADAKFRLAYGNRKPEGLADPPPGVASAFVHLAWDEMINQDRTRRAAPPDLTAERQEIVTAAPSTVSIVDHAEPLAPSPSYSADDWTRSTDQFFADLGARDSGDLEWNEDNLLQNFVVASAIR